MKTIIFILSLAISSLTMPGMQSTDATCPSDGYVVKYYTIEEELWADVKVGEVTETGRVISDYICEENSYVEVETDTGVLICTDDKEKF